MAMNAGGGAEVRRRSASSSDDEGESSFLVVNPSDKTALRLKPDEAVRVRVKPSHSRSTSTSTTGSEWDVVQDGESQPPVVLAAAPPSLTEESSASTAKKMALVVPVEPSVTIPTTTPPPCSLPNKPVGSSCTVPPKMLAPAVLPPESLSQYTTYSDDVETTFVYDEQEEDEGESARRPGHSTTESHNPGTKVRALAVVLREQEELRQMNSEETGARERHLRQEYYDRISLEEDWCWSMQEAEHAAQCRAEAEAEELEAVKKLAAELEEEDRRAARRTTNGSTPSASAPARFSHHPREYQNTGTSEDSALALALAASMQDVVPPSASASASTTTNAVSRQYGNHSLGDSDELREQRLESLEFSLLNQEKQRRRNRRK